MKTIKFTKTELDHIRSLIFHRELDGWYYGNKLQFENREKKLKEKVQILFMEAK